MFPAPREIIFQCSCPDWAVMCKHVAAVLYGVGTRLDQNPALFFTLRSVNVEELISGAIRGKMEAMLSGSKPNSRRILADADISDVFGIELEKGEIGRDQMKGRKKRKQITKLPK